MKLKPATVLPVVLAVAAYAFSFFGGSQSVREALDFCARKLVPGLFCSVTLSLFLVKSGLWSYLGSGAVAVMGLICGFPTGAIMAFELYSSGKITRLEAERVCSLFSLPSPAFVIAYVGGEVNKSLLTGAMLYLVLLIALLICDMIFYPKALPLQQNKICNKPTFALVEAVSETGGKCLTVCSVVIFFYVLGSAVNAVPFLSTTVKALLFSTLEITRAVSAAEAFSPSAAFVFTAATLAFSGVSVAAQTGLYAMKSGVYIKGYFTKRLVLSVCAALVSLALLYLPPYVFAAACALVFAIAFFGKYLNKRGKDEKCAEDTPKEGFVHISADKAEAEA